MKARYAVWGFDPENGIVYIIDLFTARTPTVTITNDAEAVVAKVVACYPMKRIVYRDTDGAWDELKHKDGKFDGFASFHGWVPTIGLHE